MRRLLLALAAMLIAAPAAAEPIEPGARTVVMTAFAPEWAELIDHVTEAKAHRVNGLTIVTGVLEGKPVVLVESGVSMVNAAMMTQLVIDRFTVRRIVFSGIAGGVDPALHIGDVVVPARWAQNLEIGMARSAAEGFRAPATGYEAVLPPYGMLYPRAVIVGNAAEPARPMPWIEANPVLLALAGKVAAHVALAPLPSHQPRVVVGGNGVSGPAFVDNAEYREYVHVVFGARVLDMESAAVAQVAYANSVPFVAFRSLSDLAGGDAGRNTMASFMKVAAGNSAQVVRAFVAALPD